MKKFQAFLFFFLVIILQIEFVYASRFYSEDASCQRGVVISDSGNTCPEESALSSAATEPPQELASSLTLLFIILVIGLFFFIKKRFNKKVNTVKKDFNKKNKK